VALEVEWRGGPAFVGGDRRRLAQATGNLIANAVEHGGGEVTVRGRLERRGGDGTPRGPLERRREDGTLNGRVAHDTVRVEVIDRGSGLPAPVTELARRPRAGRGSRGRGLAIAAAVAAAHGGRLASAPAERGARLVLELPASQGAPARAPAAG
jgi:signal transduction histidine kinase